MALEEPQSVLVLSGTVPRAAGAGGRCSRSSRGRSGCRKPHAPCAHHTAGKRGQARAAGTTACPRAPHGTEAPRGAQKNGHGHGYSLCSVTAQPGLCWDKPPGHWGVPVTEPSPSQPHLSLGGSSAQPCPQVPAASLQAARRCRAGWLWLLAEEFFQDPSAPFFGSSPLVWRPDRFADAN